MPLDIAPKERKLDTHFYISPKYRDRFDAICIAHGEPGKPAARGRTLEALVRLYERVEAGHYG
jgi:hypothetical protein